MSTMAPAILSTTGCILAVQRLAKKNQSLKLYVSPPLLPVQKDMATDMAKDLPPP